MRILGTIEKGEKKFMLLRVVKSRRNPRRNTGADKIDGIPDVGPDLCLLVRSYTEIRSFRFVGWPGGLHFPYRGGITRLTR